MKLVKILARELKKWPDSDGDSCGFIVQEEDGELYSTHNVAPFFNGSATWHRGNGDDQKCGYFGKFVKKAQDWRTAIVTREMWQAERERIAKPGKKANLDGWVRHRGGKCPVDGGMMVEYRMRAKGVGVDTAAGLDWKHFGHRTDIMAFRIYEPAEQPAPEIKVTHIDHEAGVIHAECVSSSCGPVKAEWSELLYDPIAQGPLQWRDRIREIDITVEALEEERVSLIQRLEGEGFKLIDQINASIAEAAQAHEDMSDPANWKVGDTFVQVESGSWNHCNGTKWTMEHDDGTDMKLYASEAGSGKFVKDSALRFHSRPSA